MITQGQNQLLPEATRANRRPRTLRYDISSLDRNFRTETSNKFRWRLPNPIREVCELSIVAGSIPIPAYNIWEESSQTENFSYNKFTLLYGGVRYTIIIPPNFYNSAAALSSILQLQLDSIVGPGIFGLTVPATGQFIFTAPNPFSLLFGTGDYVDQIDPVTKAVIKANSPAMMLGFLPATDYSSTGTPATVMSPNAGDVSLLINRIYVYINYDSTQDLVSFDRGIGRRQPTGILYYDYGNLCDRFTLNKDTYQPIIKFRPVPIARIAAFDIRFEDVFGRPINFLGREVSLVIECVSLEP